MVLTLSLSKKSQKTLVWYYTISTPIPHSLNLKLDYIYPLTSLLRSQAERDSESYKKTTLKIHIFSHSFFIFKTYSNTTISSIFSSQTTPPKFQKEEATQKFKFERQNRTSPLQNLQEPKLRFLGFQLQTRFKTLLLYY
jgi:hypothetical protein